MPEHDPPIEGRITESRISGTAECYELTRTEAIMSLLRYDAYLAAFAASMQEHYPDASIEKLMRMLEEAGA